MHVDLPTSGRTLPLSGLGHSPSPSSSRLGALSAIDLSGFSLAFVFDPFEQVVDIGQLRRSIGGRDGGDFTPSIGNHDGRLEIEAAD